MVQGGRLTRWVYDAFFVVVGAMTLSGSPISPSATLLYFLFNHSFGGVVYSVPIMLSNGTALTAVVVSCKRTPVELRKMGRDAVAKCHRDYDVETNTRDMFRECVPEPDGPSVTG